MKLCKVLALTVALAVFPLLLPVHAAEDFFLPLFYVPEKVVYSNMATNDLPEILSFKPYEIRTAFYLDKLNDAPGVGADGILLKVAPQGNITQEIIDTYWARENINQAFVLQRPEGIFYNFTLFLEQLEKEKIKNNVEASLESHLNYATKRISEIGKYKIAHIDLLQNYDKEMNAAFDDLEKLKTVQNKNYSLWLKRFKETVSAHRVKADSLFFGGGYSKAQEDYLRGLFAQYAKKIAVFTTQGDSSFKVYRFNIPIAGEYHTGPDTKFFNKGENMLKIPVAATPENLIGPGLRINGYLPSVPYKVSFEYRQTGGSGSLTVIEENTATPLIKSLPSTGKEFESVEFFFFSSPGAEKAKFRLLVEENKNLRVERISQPEIILENDSGKKELIPKITFRQINPTKYGIKIEGAVAPYHLVFSENFHKDWKVYLSKDDIVGNDIIAVYFDGEIKETRQKNVFLEKNIFQTWFKKPLAQNTHFGANGFANSWYITPEDVNGAKNYELIVEFWPQRLYYLGFIISSLTLSTCFLIMGLLSLLKRLR